MGKHKIGFEKNFDWWQKIFFICAFMCVLFVVLITAYMLLSGVPAIMKIGFSNFIFGTKWAPTAQDPSYGILPMILSSFYATFAAILLGVPVGLLCAVYIAKLAPQKLRETLKNLVELLAGIPSVIFGLVGVVLVVPKVAEIFELSYGGTLMSAIIVLSVMILPNIISVSENSLSNVDKGYEEGSLALGATQIETIFKISIPASRSGILSAVILGVGRAVGETMAVIMVSGNVVNMPALFESVRLMTTGIVSEMSYAGTFHRQALFAIGLVLFVFIMCINTLFAYVSKEKQEKKEAKK